MDTKQSHLFNTIEMDQWLSFADRATRGMRICLTMTMEVSSLPTTADLAYSKEKVIAEPVQIKPLISGRRRIMIDTMNTKERTEQGARKKETQFLVEVDLRDYFAAKAMAGMVANPGYAEGEWFQEEIAIQAYEMADAMLKERENKS